ncbi:AAC-rich mRNA clone AAC11 protein-like [Pistacia vera]|uniref:AAC-rich mRNA clone AAC11 protein-like n=1 Tax=Pistacia vera TaxID=55513 RepID=UPI0012631D97|nr:AAC-rich mRNA clone AAC11 protein-like [Pistacia vera]
MGCCVSSEASSISKKDELVKVGSNESSKLKAFSHESRAPPPSVEEETVKEVLSEIPKTTVKPKPDPNFTTNIKQEVQENNFLNQIQKPAVFTKIQENHQLQQQLNKNVAKKEELKNVNEENMSEVSEVCSLSFSETVSTTTNITDRRDNEEDQEVMQQHRMRNSRSPAKLPPQRKRDFGVRKDRVVAQSPTRRFEHSPGKRKPPGSVRLVQSSREEPGRVLNQSLGRGRRDPGESSGRRSRSPASTRSAAMGRSPSARRTNQSPGRSKNESGQNGSNNNSRQTESPSKMENRWPSNNNNNNNSSTNESLENPLVSLECFIFL